MKKLDATIILKMTVYHFENDCGEEFIIKEEIMTAEKQYYYEHYYDRDYCGLYKLTYRDGCHGFVTYY